MVRKSPLMFRKEIPHPRKGKRLHPVRLLTLLIRKLNLAKKRRTAVSQIQKEVNLEMVSHRLEKAKTSLQKGLNPIVNIQNLLKDLDQKTRGLDPKTEGRGQRTSPKIKDLSLKIVGPNRGTKRVEDLVLGLGHIGEKVIRRTDHIDHDHVQNQDPGSIRNRGLGRYILLENFN